MQKRQVAGLIVFIFALGLMVASAYSIVVQRATSETIIVGGPVSSQGHATIVDTLVIRNLVNVPPDAKLTINIPVYGDYADDGFSQSVVWHQPVTSPVPDTAVEAYDTFNNHYIHYEWSLNNLSGSQFTATVTTTFEYTVTSDPRPGIFTDPFPVTVTGMDRYLQRTAMAQSDDARIREKSLQVTAGATSEAEAVNAIMDFVRTQLQNPSGTTPEDAVSSLGSNAGNCENRANLALALLRSAGIPARLVTGVTTDQPLHIVYIRDNYEHDTTLSWGKELHVWVEVYYPQKGTWVPYDPGLNKGFVDIRHVMSGTALDTNVTNPSTGGAPYYIHLYANADVAVEPPATGISFTGIQDTGSYVFRSLDPSPAGLLSLGRDMTNHPTVTPAPTPGPTPVPVATPAPNTTATPGPGAPTTPAPGNATNATATPAPPGSDDNSDLNVTRETGKDTYNISGSVVDASNMAMLNGATLTFDGQPFQADARGAFTLAATNGTHTLIVAAPGYGSASLTLTVAGADVVRNVRLSQAAGNGTTKPAGRTPGFELITALTGLLIIVLYRHGRA